MSALSTQVNVSISLRGTGIAGLVSDRGVRRGSRISTRHPSPLPPAATPPHVVAHLDFGGGHHVAAAGRCCSVEDMQCQSCTWGSLCPGWCLRRRADHPVLYTSPYRLAVLDPTDQQGVFQRSSQWITSLEVTMVAHCQTSTCFSRYFWKEESWKPQIPMQSLRSGRWGGTG